MNVLRADALGLCFGVRDALATAGAVSQPGLVTIHGELVHNEAVLVQLQSRGFSLAAERDRQHLPETPRVLVTAHGISDRERRRLETAGKQLIDTTCPLVRRVHLAARALSEDGWHVLVIGRPGHVEVQGIIEDLSSCDVISEPAAVRTYPHLRLGVVCQTTTPPRLVGPVVDAIRSHNPRAEIRVADTICLPTRERQQAVLRLLGQVDAVVIVGSRNSNNTLELVSLCRERGMPARHIQSAQDLVPAWFAGCRTVGLTAGTSTLDETIDEVHAALSRI